MRPKGYLTVALLLGLFSFSPLLSFGHYNGGTAFAGPFSEILSILISIALGLGVTLCFWWGFTWSRIVIQVAYFVNGSFFFDYLNDPSAPNLRPPTFWELNSWVAQTAFGVFLLYWLNTKRVRTYCKERKMRAVASKLRYQDSDFPPIASPH